MALDTPDLFLKDFVPESSLKLSLAQRCCRDAHSVLATTEQDVRLERCDRCAIESCLRDVRLENRDRPSLV